MMEKRYIPKLDITVSPLGFGVMRLPMENGRIKEETKRSIPIAMDAGINYYDTAYSYLSGLSEIFIREELVKRYKRDAFYIADKMPVWTCFSYGDFERIFNEQLERLGVEYIDLYLFHAINRSRWDSIHKIGAIDFFEKKKKEGRIRRAGFSFHDDSDVLCSVLDAYDWDFVQLQLNYYDWTAINAKANYDLAVKRDLPCIVMNPAGGGRLTKLPDKAVELLKDAAPNSSVSSWAMRFTASLESVAVTLSGMRNETDLLDNISTFENFVSLSKKESEIIDQAVKIIRSYASIPCTSCEYCLGECPKKINIPYILQLYNDYQMFGASSGISDNHLSFLPEGKRAKDCINCGKCSEKCPQSIDIPKQLKMIHRAAIGHAFWEDREYITKYLSNAKSPLVCFGASSLGVKVKDIFAENGYAIDYFCDNSAKLWGTTISGVPVISPAQAKEINASVVITSSYYAEIKKQLEDMGVCLING